MSDEPVPSHIGALFVVLVVVESGDDNIVSLDCYRWKSIVEVFFSYQ
jgi:hypothetical protein